MSRQDAENLLVQDGDFLVRESTTNPGQYVLTGLQNGYPKHLLLIDPEGVVSTLAIRFRRESKVTHKTGVSRMKILNTTLVYLVFLR